VLYYLTVISSIAIFIYTAKDVIATANNIDLAVESARVASLKAFAQPTTAYVFSDSLFRNPQTNQPKPLMFDDAGFNSFCHAGVADNGNELDKDEWTAVQSLQCVMYNGSPAVRIVPTWGVHIFDRDRNAKKTCTTTTTQPAEPDGTPTTTTDCSGDWVHPPDAQMVHACQFGTGPWDATTFVELTHHNWFMASIPGKFFVCSYVRHLNNLTQCTATISGAATVEWTDDTGAVIGSMSKQSQKDGNTYSQTGQCPPVYMTRLTEGSTFFMDLPSFTGSADRFNFIWYEAYALYQKPSELSVFGNLESGGPSNVLWNSQDMAQTTSIGELVRRAKANGNSFTVPVNYPCHGVTALSVDLAHREYKYLQEGSRSTMDETRQHVKYNPTLSSVALGFTEDGSANADTIKKWCGRAWPNTFTDSSVYIKGPGEGDVATPEGWKTEFINKIMWASYGASDRQVVTYAEQQRPVAVTIAGVGGAWSIASLFVLVFFASVHKPGEEEGTKKTTYKFRLGSLAGIKAAVKENAGAIVSEVAGGLGLENDLAEIKGELGSLIPEDAQAILEMVKSDGGGLEGGQVMVIQIAKKVVLAFGQSDAARKIANQAISKISAKTQQPQSRTTDDPLALLQSMTAAVADVAEINGQVSPLVTELVSAGQDAGLRAELELYLKTKKGRSTSQKKADAPKICEHVMKHVGTPFWEQQIVPKLGSVYSELEAQVLQPAMAELADEISPLTIPDEIQTEMRAFALNKFDDLKNDIKAKFELRMLLLVVFLPLDLAAAKVKIVPL
jgi:hypothetical protein